MASRTLTIRYCMAKRGGLGAGCVHHRPAFAYFLALGTASIVMVIGLSVMISLRLEGRRNSEEIFLVGARTVSLSGLEHALATIKANGAWRTDFLHGVVGATHTLGEGEFSWTLFDTSPFNDLAADANGSVDVVVTGLAGPAAYTVRVELDFSAGDGSFVIGVGGKKRS